MRAVLLLLLIACGGSDPAKPPVPLPVASLSGTYTVNLARVITSPANPNFSCQQLQVTVTPPLAWAVLACTRQGFEPTTVEIKADSIILNLVEMPSTQLVPFRFGGFTGSPENARAVWVGGSCVNSGGVCIPETGVSVWRR